MTIINIVGKKGSGKSTAAKYLVEKYGYVRLSFARHLKETVRLLFGFTEEQINGKLKEVVDYRYGISPREAQQWFGDVMREKIGDRFPVFMEKIGKNFWVNKLLEELHIMQEEGITGFCIDDCRYQAEASAIINYVNQNNESENKEWIRLETVRIVREQDLNRELTAIEKHSSETELENIKYDIKIDNTNLTLEELYAKLDTIT